MILSLIRSYKSSLRSSILLLFTVFTLIYTQILHPMEEFDLDDFVNDPSWDQFLEQNEFSMTKNIDPADILSILILQLKILDILKEDLYCKTYPLNYRSLLDMPFVRPYRWHKERDRKFGLQLFYNQTSRMFFTKKCDSLYSYLAICNPNLLRKLSELTSQEIIRDQFPNFNLDPLCVFPLFKNMTIQDRRAGFMFSGSHRWRWLTFRALVPLYYLERNFFLTDEERRKVEDIFGAQSDTTFQDQHLISDKLGVGDTRLIFAFHIIRRENIALNLGFQATVPTAFAFTKGVKGSSFEQWKKIKHRHFSLEELWNLAQQGGKAGTEYGTDFFLGALDTLSANLIDAELGNNQHPGIGFFMQTRSRLSFFFKRPWAHNIKYKGTLSFEYLFPKSEHRFFLIKTDKNALDENLYDDERAQNDPAYARGWLTLIEETFTNKFYPVSLNTRVQPGIIFQWTSNLFYERGPWRFQIGTDWWIQGPTSLEAVDVPQYIGSPCIDIKKAEPPFAFQSKVCGGIFYSLKRPAHEWNISLYGDYTYWSKGIGRDFTLSFNVELDF